MHLVVLILILFTTIIFFRDDFFIFLKKFEKYSFLLMNFLLLSISYELFMSSELISHFLQFINHNLLNFKYLIFKLLSHLLSYQQIDRLSDYVLRALVLGFCIFYPYRYRRKFSSLIYKQQSFWVNLVYKFFLVFLCLFFAKIT